MLGTAESIPAPRAGDVCRLASVPGLWVPFGRPKSGLARGLGATRFVRFPDGRADVEGDTVLVGIASVEEVVHGHDSREARDFWTTQVAGVSA